MENTREDFGVRQAEMTARWYENVKRSHTDVDAYIQARHNAYLGRWKEAARFIEDASRVLDIGGGNIYPALVEFWKERGFRYSYLDIDPSCVDGSKWLAKSLGMADATFDHGYNDSLPFADLAFDAIFSSHCLEHSFDLTRTLGEVNRVLDIHGNLLMAVPFGWEVNPEHPYFLGPTEWLSLLSDAGFRIRVAQIGCEYPESGYDYFVAAQKIAPAGAFRLDPGDYTKTKFDFVSPFDGRLSYNGESVLKEDHVIMNGDQWTIEFEVPSGTREVLPILNRHEWSGIIEVSWDDQSVQEDCYSFFSYAQPMRIKAVIENLSSVVRIKSQGKNASSFASQGVLYGLMIR